MAKNLLSALKIDKARPTGKPYRLHDGEGLYLLVGKTGTKSWQFRYKPRHGSDVTISFGLLSSLPLADARKRADHVRRGRSLSLDPRSMLAEERARIAADSAATFEKFAAAWVTREARRAEWTEEYRVEVVASLANHLAGLNPVSVAKITAAVAAPVLAAIEERAPHMHDKVRRRLRAILDDAVEAGIITANPLPNARRRNRKGQARHYPAVTALEPLGAILRDARASDPCKGIRRAHTLLAFTAQRVGEIVPAAWPEFDLETGTWAIPRQRMKRKDPQRGAHHLVPLPPTLLAMLRAWRDEDGPHSHFICPAPRDSNKPITAEAIEKHYRRALGLAGQHSPHSWRSAFSTLCRDAGKSSDVIESQLDHVIGSNVVSAYDRGARLELRRTLMAWYEETLIAARDERAGLSATAAS